MNKRNITNKNNLAIKIIAILLLMMFLMTGCSSMLGIGTLVKRA